MALKDEGLLITVNGTKAMTGSIMTCNTISHNELVCVPLKLMNIFPGLQRLLGL